MKHASSKISWSGQITGIQPRIRLTRSFDQRSHSYLGYVLRIDGLLGDEERGFVVAIGKALHAKQEWRIGDRIRGLGVPVEDPNIETADLYKVRKVERVEVESPSGAAGPPYQDLCPPLETYRQRGHRRLAATTFAAKCTSCMWGCEMAVELIIDQWNPSQRRYRRETFCYGPKNCPTYKAGPTRKVPGRRGMSFEEDDWIDEEATAHREPDE